MTIPSRALTYVAPVFRVADLDRSLAFYCEKLGFAVEFNFEDLYASVVRDGCHIHLKADEPLPRDDEALAADEHLDACLMVTDAAALADSLAAAGVAFAVPPRTMLYGREFYIRDPDGYILGFVEPAG